MRDLAGYLADPGAVAGLTPEERAEVQRAVAVHQQRLGLLVEALTEAPQRAPAPEPEPPQRWLTVAEAAEVASVPRSTVYGWSHRADWQAFVRRPTRGTVRIQEDKFKRWLERGGGQARNRAGAGARSPSWCRSSAPRTERRQR